MGSGGKFDSEGLAALGAERLAEILHQLAESDAAIKRRLRLELASTAGADHVAGAIRIDRRLKAIDVIDVLSDLFILRGVPEHIRSDNGPEFVAKAVQAWIAAVGAKTAYIAPGSPWENGFIESFNARLRDELLDG